MTVRPGPPWPTCILAVVACLAGTTAGATTVSSPLSTDTVWTPAGNPYVVTVGYPTPLVPEGVTLTLEPGVVVQSAGTITIAGTLLAEGTAAAHIVFDEAVPGQRFGGLTLKRLTPGEPVHVHRLTYVDIANLGTEISLDRHSLVMSHCLVAASNGTTRRLLATFGGVMATYPTATLSVADSAFTLTSSYNGAGWTPTDIAGLQVDGHDAVLSDNTITVATTGTFVSTSGIRALASNTGASVVDTRGNTITVLATSLDAPYTYGIRYESFEVSGTVDDNILPSVTGPEHVYGIVANNASRASGNTVAARSSSEEVYADVVGVQVATSNPATSITGNRIDVSSDSQNRTLRGLVVQAGTIARNRITGRHDGPSGSVTAISQQYYPASIVHNTVVLGPCADVACRGISPGNTGGDVLVRNNILVGPGDTASIGVLSYASLPATVTADFNLFHGWGTRFQDAASGGGDVLADPQFADAAFHLATGSPAIDAGHWESPFDGEPMPNGGRADIGAFGNTSEAAASVAILAPVITTNGGLDFATAATTVVVEGLTSAATTAVLVNGATTGVTFTPGTTAWRYDGGLVHGANPVVVGAMRGAASSATDAIAVQAVWPPTVSSVSASRGAESGGTALTVTGTHFVAGATAVTIGGAAAANVTVTSPTTLSATSPAHDGPGPTDVVVTTPDGSATLPGAFTYRQVRYFAEGAANDMFDMRLAVANPTHTDASVEFRFLTSSCAVVPHTLVVPAMSRQTVDAGDVAALAPAEFSTVIDSDVAVIIDRTLTWADGTHAERAVVAPSRTWYLAEGATHSGFDLFYLLQNPSPTQSATVTVTYLLPAGAPVVAQYVVAPSSRQNIWVNHEQLPAGSGVYPLASTDVSATFDASLPIIVERALYLSSSGATFLAGHESAGVTAPSLAWFLAEGATGDYFDLFLLLANPDTRAAAVDVQFLLPDGTVVARSYQVAPQSRQNIWVDYEDAALASTAVSSTVTVTNGVPIIVERALWWPGTPATWHEAHNSPGSTQAGTQWVVAEGENGGPAELETYLLVANTSGAPATIDVTALFPSGAPVTRRFAIPARARFNISAVEFPEMAGQRFGAIVESVGASPAQIVVERAMYCRLGGRPWGGGSNALATRLR